MTTSWEFRVFVTKEAFSENVALQETLGKMAKRPGIGSWLTISKKREPRTDAYVAFQESKSYERCEIGVKIRGVREKDERQANTKRRKTTQSRSSVTHPPYEVKLRLAVGSGKWAKGLEKWAKYKDVAKPDLSTVARLILPQGATDLGKEVATVKLTKERDEYGKFQVDNLSHIVVERGERVSKVEGKEWVSLCVESSKLEATRSKLLQWGLNELVGQCKGPVVYGGYPAFTDYLVQHCGGEERPARPLQTTNSDGAEGGGATLARKRSCTTGKPGIRILIATSSPSKVRAVELAAREVFAGETVVCTSAQGVVSSVSEQPIGNCETLTGALNRIESAKQQKCQEEGRYDFVVGIESGLVQCKEAHNVVPEKPWFDIAWVVVEHVKTKVRVSIPSMGIIFPTDYVMKSEGTGFRQTAGDFMAGDNLVADPKDPHESLCGKKRALILKDAVHVALVQLHKKTHHHHHHHHH